MICKHPSVYLFPRSKRSTHTGKKERERVQRSKRTRVIRKERGRAEQCRKQGEKKLLGKIVLYLKNRAFLVVENFVL